MNVRKKNSVCDPKLTHSTCFRAKENVISEQLLKTKRTESRCESATFVAKTANLKTAPMLHSPLFYNKSYRMNIAQF